MLGTSAFWSSYGCQYTNILPTAKESLIPNRSICNFHVSGIQQNLGYCTPYSTSYLINNKQLRVGLYDPSIEGNTTAEYMKQLIATPYYFPLLIMLIIAQLPTLLLLLYPIKAFRRLLRCCGSSRYHAIYAFVDTFQGHYKDGAEITEQYRALASCLRRYFVHI